MCWWMEAKPRCSSKMAFSLISFRSTSKEEEKILRYRRREDECIKVKIWPSSTSCTNPVFAPLPLFSWFNSDNSLSTAGQTQVFPQKWKTRKDGSSESHRLVVLLVFLIGSLDLCQITSDRAQVNNMVNAKVCITLDTVFFGVNRSRFTATFTADSKTIATHAAAQPFFLHQNKNHF